MCCRRRRWWLGRWKMREERRTELARLKLNWIFHFISLFFTTIARSPSSPRIHSPDYCCLLCSIYANYMTIYSVIFTKRLCFRPIWDSETAWQGKVLKWTARRPNSSHVLPEFMSFLQTCRIKREWKSQQAMRMVKKDIISCVRECTECRPIYPVCIFETQSIISTRQPTIPPHHATRLRNN